MLSNTMFECYIDNLAVSEDLREMNTNVATTGVVIQELRLDNQQERLENQQERLDSQQERLHNQQERIVRLLSASDPSTNYTNAREKRHSGTGIWFIHDEAFEKWKRQTNSFLWLYGIAGCGKTVLSSTIIEHLKSYIQPDRSLLYFYFAFDDPSKQTLEDMLRSLTIQLYQAQPEARNPLDDLWRAWGGSNQHLSKQVLHAILLEMLSKINDTSIVLDALDEASTRSDLLAWLKSVHEFDRSVRILVTARREQDIESALQNWTQPGDMIEIQESVIDGDIRAYVHHRVRNSSELDRWQNWPEVQDEIESELVKKADGM